LYGYALVVLVAGGAWAQEQRKTDTQDKPTSTALAVPPGEDAVGTFVPRKPQTVQDRERIETLQEYAAARALEDRRQWTDAVEMYEKALKREPNSISILRRLSGLCFALGRVDQAVNYGQRVLENEPGDVKTMSLLVGFFVNRKRDPSAAEAVLKKVLANPKLDKNAAGSLTAQRLLGDLYADRLDQPEKAADAYARVVEALDAKRANQLSHADQKAIVEGDEVESYMRFGEAFLKVKRYDLAVRSFQRGLSIEPDHPRLPMLAAQALLAEGKGTEALAVLEPYIRRQPQGLEAYELLAQVLNELKRGNELLPRLEKAAELDSKNVALQYALAEAYRKDGQVDKAEEKLKALLAAGASDPVVLAGLAGTFLKEKKYEELIKLLGDAITKPNGAQAVGPAIESLVNDSETAAAILDAGVKLLANKPDAVSPNGRALLLFIADKAKQPQRFIALQRQILKLAPNPQGYQQFFIGLMRSSQFADAAAVLEEMLEKFPAEKSPPILTNLGRARSAAGNNDGALESVNAALELDPKDAESLLFKAFLLGKMAKNDEAVALYKDIVKRFPDDADIFKSAHSGLSAVYVNQNKMAEGERELEILLEKYPDDAGVNNDLGYLYADQGKHLEKAEAMIRKAVEEEPENGAYLDSLGWVLFKRDKLKDAVEPLEKAVKAQESDATIHDHLGDVYYALKDGAKAKHAWERAQEIAAKANPPDKKLEEIRKKLQFLKERGVAGKPGDNP
jgi:tetratricopeptide (TPR) repeat protein